MKATINLERCQKLIIKKLKIIRQLQQYVALQCNSNNQVLAGAGGVVIYNMSLSVLISSQIIVPESCLGAQFQFILNPNRYQL